MIISYSILLIRQETATGGIIIIIVILHKKLIYLKMQFYLEDWVEEKFKPRLFFVNSQLFLLFIMQEE
jgi:hypothetical protein